MIEAGTRHFLGRYWAIALSQSKHAHMLPLDISVSSLQNKNAHREHGKSKRAAVSDSPSAKRWNLWQHYPRPLIDSRTRGQVV